MHAKVTLEVRCSRAVVRLLSSTASFPGAKVALNPSGQVLLYHSINSVELFFKIKYRISFLGVYTQVSYFVEWIALAMQ